MEIEGPDGPVVRRRMVFGEVVVLGVGGHIFSKIPFTVDIWQSQTSSIIDVDIRIEAIKRSLQDVH